MIAIRRRLVFAGLDHLDAIMAHYFAKTGAVLVSDIRQQDPVRALMARPLSLRALQSVDWQGIENARAGVSGSPPISGPPSPP
jgi:hypothetical protein